MVDVLQEHGTGHERFFLVHLEIIPKLLHVYVYARHRTVTAKRFLETILSDPSFHDKIDTQRSETSCPVSHSLVSGRVGIRLV